MQCEWGTESGFKFLILRDKCKIGNVICLNYKFNPCGIINNWDNFINPLKFGHFFKHSPNIQKFSLTPIRTNYGTKF
jgi:hypothetical protein